MPDNFDDGADYSGFPPEDQAWFRDNKRRIDQVSKETGEYQELIEHRRERWLQRGLWSAPAHWNTSPSVGLQRGPMPGVLEIRREKSFVNPPHWKT